LGNTTAAGAGVAIPAGKTMTVWSDGTDFALQNTHIIGTVVGNVTGNVTGNLTGNVTGNVTGNTSGTAGSVATTNWTIAQSGTSIVFSYNGVAKLALTSAGALTAVDDITAYGTV
jgi:hypothetical protein